MRAELIPASLHCGLSDFIEWERSPFYVNPEGAGWPRRAQPRLECGECLWAGGANAHVVVEVTIRYPIPLRPPETTRRRCPSICWRFLRRHRRHWRSVLQTWVRTCSARVTCPERRRLHAPVHARQHPRHRVAFIVSTFEQAIALLQGRQPAQRVPAVFSSKVPATFVAQPLLLDYAGNASRQTQRGPRVTAVLSTEAARAGGAVLSGLRPSLAEAVRRVSQVISCRLTRSSANVIGRIVHPR